jgi:hypothetical protein
MPNRTGRKAVSGGIGGKLTDKACKAFVRTAERGKKLADGGGLHLFITPAGGATWRVKYRIEAKEKSYSVGPYPLVSLAAARVELAEVKALLLEHKDPVTERRVSRAATTAGSDNTFKVVAQEWLAMKQREWSAVHHAKSQRAFERDVYPAIGDLPVSSNCPAIVAKAIEDIHKRDVLETATRILQLGLEGEHSPHGWRSAFSTLARDHGFARDVVELALDHAHDNEVARAYDRGERFTKRG